MITKDHKSLKALFTEHPEKASIFDDLSEDELQLVLENSIQQNYPSGKRLVEQGDEPRYAYFIIDGLVKTARSNAEGETATIRLLEPGDICMEAVIFMGGPSPIAVETSSTCQLILIPAAFIRKFVLESHAFANNLLRIVTHHYKTAIHQVEAMAYKSPVQRVGYYFLEKHLERGQSDMKFDLPFKKSVVANHLGITPETFSRALGTIRKLGIDIDGDKVTLREAFSLCHFCDHDSANMCQRTDRDQCPACPLNNREISA